MYFSTGNIKALLFLYYYYYKCKRGEAKVLIMEDQMTKRTDHQLKPDTQYYLGNVLQNRPLESNSDCGHPLTDLMTNNLAQLSDEKAKQISIILSNKKPYPLHDSIPQQSRLTVNYIIMYELLGQTLIRNFCANQTEFDRLTKKFTAILEIFLR